VYRHFANEHVLRDAVLRTVWAGPKAGVRVEALGRSTTCRTSPRGSTSTSRRSRSSGGPEAGTRRRRRRWPDSSERCSRRVAPLTETWSDAERTGAAAILDVFVEHGVVQRASSRTGELDADQSIERAEPGRSGVIQDAVRPRSRASSSEHRNKGCEEGRGEPPSAGSGGASQVRHQRRGTPMTTTDYSSTDLFRDRELPNDPYPFYEWIREARSDLALRAVGRLGWSRATRGSGRRVPRTRRPGPTANTISGPFYKMSGPAGQARTSRRSSRSIATSWPFTDQPPVLRSASPHRASGHCCCGLITPKRLKEKRSVPLVVR